MDWIRTQTPRQTVQSLSLLPRVLDTLPYSFSLSIICPQHFSLISLSLMCVCVCVCLYNVLVGHSSFVRLRHSFTLDNRGVVGVVGVVGVADASRPPLWRGSPPRRMHLAGMDRTSWGSDPHFL
jgi:hypothetical protein